MNTFSSIAIVILAALIHSSFQLSVSVLTMLSTHALGAKKSQSKLLRLTTGFLIGAGIMTALIVGDSILVCLSMFGGKVPEIIWTIACGLAGGVAIAIWLFYYQKDAGTSLWIPRPVAKYLSDRTKATKSSVEAFSLGMTSVFGELLFIIAPIFITGVVLSTLPSIWQLFGIVIYTIISLLPLVAVWMLVGSGHSISKIQKWREKNKHFLQFASGAGLIVLAFFVFVNQVITTTVVAGLN